MGVPPKWMVYFMENPRMKWMTGGTPVLGHQHIGVYHRFSTLIFLSSPKAGTGRLMWYLIFGPPLDLKMVCMSHVTEGSSNYKSETSDVQNLKSLKSKDAKLIGNLMESSRICVWNDGDNDGPDHDPETTRGKRFERLGSPRCGGNSTWTAHGEITTVASTAGWWARGKTPLKNMSSSIGMMTATQLNGKIQNWWQPNHQPDSLPIHVAGHLPLMAIES